MENPYLSVPQVENAQSRSWASGFLFGFQGPEDSTMAQDDVETEDRDAFNEGVLAGQGSAINGLDFGDSCVDLNVEGPSTGEIAADLGAETVLTTFSIAKLGFHLAGAISEAVIGLVVLSIELETFSDDPDHAIAARATALQSALATMGITNSMVLYLGGGIDLSQPGCELQLTRIYRSEDAAVEAAKAIGRGKWLVASWRTDQSGGMSIPDHSLDN